MKSFFYYPIFRISGMFEFRKPIFIIRDPKLAKKLAIKDFENFADHRPMIDEHMDKMLGKSLFFLRGQKWKGRNDKFFISFTQFHWCNYFLKLCEQH